MMSSPITFHPADDEQRLAAYRNVHEFWDGGRTLGEHLAWRLVSPQHNRARWFVGCLEGEVVVSLGSYPLELCIEGELINGIMIGAVHTIPSQRGHGYAPALLGWVEEQEAEQGAVMSILFTDIGTEYYARFEYIDCPSWEIRVETGNACASWELERVVGRDHAEDLRRWYEHSTSGDALALVRDDAYWDYCFLKQPDDLTFLARDEAGAPSGYVRIRCRKSEWTIQDWGLAEQSGEHLTALILAVAVQARLQDCPLLTGWMPSWSTGNPVIELQSRAGMNHTMIKSLSEKRQFGGAVVEAAQNIREIDHV
jgi:predicted N-acetyltransferase YhbS